MVRYLFYTTGDLTYQSPVVYTYIVLPHAADTAIQFIVTQQQLGKLLSGEGVITKDVEQGCSRTLQRP